MLRIAIDIGGTFTDIVAETESGLHSVKILTTPDAPETAALQGTAELLHRLQKSHADIDSVVHGTTLATNALIERRGAKTAFITTAGFRDVLEMRYEKRFDQYALNIELPQPLVARPQRFGLNERVLADGTVLTQPVETEIDALCATLQAQQVEAVAIGFLHAYRNPANEQTVANRVQSQLGPTVTVCQSAQVAGEIREYERFSTVVANAYVRPLMTRYLERLQTEFRQQGFNGSLLMMLSDGALTTVENAMRFPIRLAEGGPAGGVALAAFVAKQTDSKKTLSLDIGGTTAKICFIQHGKPQTTRLFEVARSWRDVKGSGLPVRVPTVELVEIGAGGGSIASVDALDRLKVGPRSAGSEPGPAAYQRGGNQATITDAHLTLGNLTADGFADGMIALSPDAAAQAVKNDIQSPLNLASIEQAAAGIVELADETMANAARVHGVELGLDVAGFDLLVSGGGGGLHAARIAEKLGIRRVIVPAHAGVGSAVGFLRSPVAFESAITVMEPLNSIDCTALEDRLQTTRSEISRIVDDANVTTAVTIETIAELRYRGQGLELSMPLPSDAPLEDAIPELVHLFETQYKKLNGFVLENIEIELASVSVCARSVTPASTQSQPAKTLARDPAIHTRQYYDPKAKDTFQIPEHSRYSMGTEALTGPLVVPEAQTTTLVRTGWNIKNTTLGHLVMERAD